MASNIQPVHVGKLNPKYQKELLTVGQLSDISGVPQWKINKYRRLGKIPFVRIAEQFKYPPYALDDVLIPEVYDASYGLMTQKEGAGFEV